MATNLLLEGDDLEALLLRAAAEGGANARILRAEKVRQGGFMGFFAREHFEVAVEIPDAVEVQDPDGAAAAGSAGTPSDRRPGRQEGRPQGRQQGQHGQQGQQARPPVRPARAYDEADDEQVAALVAALSQDRTPEPGMLAAEGLLGLADRVSAAERAAAGGAAGRPAGPDDSVDVRSGPPNALAGARARSAFERYLPQSSPAPSEPGSGPGGPASGWWAGVPTPAHGIAALSAANGIDGVVPWTEPVAAAAARAVDERIAADRADAAQADAERAFAEEQAAAEAVIRAAVESRRGAVPHEPAAAPPARPSTSTPEFTALLDTLRSDVRPAAQPAAQPAAEPAARPAPRPAPRPAARTTAAAMPLQRSAGTGTARVQVTVEPAPPGALGGAAVDATPEPFEPLGPFRAAAAAVAEPVDTRPVDADPVDADPVDADPADADPVAADAEPPVEAPGPTTAPEPPVAQGPTTETVDGATDDAADSPADAEAAAGTDAPTAPLAPVHPLHAVPQDAVTRIGQPVALVAPPSQRTPVPPLVPATPPSVQTARGLLVALGADDDEPYEPESTDHDGSTDLQVSADRRALRRLGVPASWTRRYKGPDRFSGVLRMLDRLPTSDIDPDTRIVAVVGPAPLVALEAHRTALDLPIDDRPRPVVVVPPRPGQARRAAIARAQKLTAGVVAIATEDDVEGLLDTLQAVGAGAVVAVVEAGRGLVATQAWLESLDTVDALVVEGAAGVPDPAAVLQLDLPVVRLDGIPVDRVTWSALLCARMLTSLGLDPVTDRPSARPAAR